MGETVRRGRFRDRWRVRRDGVLVFADGASMDGDLRTALTRPLALGAWCAFATILWVSPQAEPQLDELRAAMGVGRDDPWAPSDEPSRPQARDGIRLGVSAWDDLLSIRIAARDGAALRRALERALQPLRQGRPLPTVWRC